MNKPNISENIQEIISDIDNKNFKNVLVKMEFLLKNYPDVNLLSWENEIKNYEKMKNLLKMFNKEDKVYHWYKLRSN